MSPSTMSTHGEHPVLLTQTGIIYPCARPAVPPGGAIDALRSQATRVDQLETLVTSKSVEGNKQKALHAAAGADPVHAPGLNLPIPAINAIAHADRSDIEYTDDLDVTTGSLAEELFEDSGGTPSVQFAPRSWAKSHPQPGAHMPVADTHHSMRLAKGAGLTWQYFNPEQPQTVRKVNIRKRGSTPFQIKLPGMSSRVKARDGCVISPQRYSAHVNPLHSNEIVSPPARPYITPVAPLYRGHPHPAPRAVNISWEWPRPHHTGWSVAAAGHCSPRHRLPFAHHKGIMHWTAVPVHALNAYHGPLPTINSEIAKGRTTYSLHQVLKVPPATSIFPEGRSSKDMIDVCNQHDSHIRDACDSTPSATSIPKSDSWEELCKDMLRVAAEVRISVALLESGRGAPHTNLGSLLDAEISRQGVLNTSRVLGDWKIWGQRVFRPIAPTHGRVIQKGKISRGSSFGSSQGLSRSHRHV